MSDDTIHNKIRRCKNPDCDRIIHLPAQPRRGKLPNYCSKECYLEWWWANHRRITVSIDVFQKAK